MFSLSMELQKVHWWRWHKLVVSVVNGNLQLFYFNIICSLPLLFSLSSLLNLPNITYFDTCSNRLYYNAGELGSHSNEISDIERNIRSMQNDMTKLNQLITKEHGYKMDLQQSNILMENDFILSLKVTWHEWSMA